MTSAYASSILRKTLCHASQAQKNKTTMKRAKFKKIRNLQLTKALQFLAFALLMAVAPAVWAQGFPPYHNDPQSLPEWRGQNDGSFKITRDTVIGNLVDVYSGKKLYLYPVGTPTITKTVEAGELFKVRDKGELYIIGQKGDTLKIYGNSGNPNGPIPRLTTYQGAAIFGTGTPEMNPQIWLKYVEFYGFITNTCVGGSDGVNHTQGGIVTMGNNGTNTSKGVCRMDHVIFKNSYGGPVKTDHYRGFGRIISFVKGVWEVEMDSVKIHDCIISEPLSGYHLDGGIRIGGMGSVIRSQGQVGGSLTMRNCEAYNNTYRDLSERDTITKYQSMDQINAQPLSGQGGVVNWRSGRKPVYDPILDNDTLTQVTLFGCKFYNNSAQCGGAVATCAAINMDSTEIFGNEAERGGGVYFYTYNGTDAPYDGHGFRAIFGKGVDIHDNSASKYGGGVYLTFDASDDVGFEPDGSHTPMSPEFKLEINEGSEIHDNKAPKGSGIALMDACPYSHCFYGTNNWSLEYQRTVTVNGGKVYDNYAEGTEGEKMAGGGIYIEKYEYYEGHPLFKFHKDYIGEGNSNPNAQSNSGILNVNLLSGEIFGNSAVNDDISGYGGGVYIASVFTADSILSELNVTISHDTIPDPIKIYNNEAYTDGGGVYVRYDREDGRQNEGIVTVKGGTIGKIDTTDPQNPVLCPNNALNGNGGGICVMSGTVVVENGHVNYNTANQNGGGIYLNDGNLTFTGGYVDQNEASNGNGGGICVMGGIVEMDGGQVDYNTANQNGGGIYLNGGDLTFTGGNVEQNEASEGNGGGICVLGGTVDVYGGFIEHNKADQDGGGIYLNDSNGAEIQIFGNVSISQNEASKGNGGGICVEFGDMYIISDRTFDDVYGDDPYTTNAAEAESTQARITKNKALQGNGGGVYVGDGYLYFQSALLYNNEAKLDGGGGYVGTGYSLSYDAKILQNTAEQSGGGMSCFSGDFDIHGGDISYNNAINGDGGGCCIVEKGSMFLWPVFNSMETMQIGTIVSHNKAGGNGGGLYNNAGLFDLILAEVHHNEAGLLYDTDNTLGGNGGGIFCNTDYNNFFDIRLYESSIDDNNAYGNSNDVDNPTGWGGGIYIQEGTIYSEHSFLRGNTAQMNGGGISCFSGDLRFYATTIGEENRSNTATNGKGGGIHTHQGNIVIGPCTTFFNDFGDMSSFIEHNTAKFDGGGICNLQGNITLIRSGINQNTAQTGKGGGVFINDGNITMKGGQINNNQANDPAGGYGGGVYSGGGVFHIMERQPNPIVELISVAESEANPGKHEFYYKLTHQGREINGSSELKHGISYTTDSISWDEIEFGSEGVPSYYVSDEDAATIVYGLVSGETYYVKAWAWYVDGDGNRYYGESFVEEVYISSKAKSKAKGKASNRPRSIHPSVEENPFFMELTPLQQAIMANTPEADSTTFRKRKNRPVRDGEPSDTPEINYNTATYGGGVYVDEEDAELIFSGGEIKANSASEDGGGVYITQNASMQMKHHCQVVDNHVPAGKDGGGIYLDGTLLVGENEEDAPTEHSLKVEKNWAGNGVYDEAERNNVYLPLAPILDGDALHKKRVITLLSDISGKTNNNFNTKIGISVDRGSREVIYSENDEHEGNATSSKQWLEKLMPESGNVLNSSLFDDAQTYYALHVTPTDDLFDEDYIYFWTCWTTIVNTDPNTDPNNDGTTHYTTNNESGANEVWHIYTREGLAWFSSRINGLNDFHEDANPAAKAFVENDLDMRAHLWVPLGSVESSQSTGTDIIFTDGGQYSGAFDGQGNIISGLICTCMTGIFKYGLFGTLADGAKVKNTFVDDYKYLTYKQKTGTVIGNPAYKMGGIAAEMDGTAVISNCEARGQLRAVICDKAETYVGGLVGKTKGTSEKPAVIHSSMAMPDIYGATKYVGGLVGELGANTKLLNSFSNPKFPDVAYNDTICLSGQYVGDPPVWQVTDKENIYFGGLVGVNNGLVENCYSRLQGDEPKSNVTTSSNYNKSIFGWFAGKNNYTAAGETTPAVIGTIKYCYAPRVANDESYDYANFNYIANPIENSVLELQANYGATKLESGKYGFKHRDQQMTTNTQNGNINNDVFLGGLLPTLNKWVTEANTQQTPTGGESGGGESGGSGSNEDPGGGSGGEGTTTEENPIVYSSWTRTMASPINDDYPIPMLTTKGTNEKFNSVGSKDGIYLLYEDNINDMWSETGKNFQSVNGTPGNAAMFLYDVQPLVNVSSDPESPVLKPCDVTISGNTNVPLYIHEDIGITQGDGNLLTARVGVTIKDGDWHLFSSAISGAPMGVVYNTGDPVYGSSVDNDTYYNRDLFDPKAKTSWTQSSSIYFPTDTPYGTWKPTSGLDGAQTAEDVGGYFDLYDYSESYYHWINYKRNNNDHWHMDTDKAGNHQRFKNDYENDTYMVAGKGYLMSLSHASMMMADGVLENRSVSVDLGKSGYDANIPENVVNEGKYTYPWRGIHLLGNPYQSYLNFNAMGGGKASDGNLLPTYAIVDESRGGKDHYVYYTKSQSRNAPLYASGYIHPHQGFFVKVTGNYNFSFGTRVAGTSTTLNAPFRDQIDYPLVNLLCYDEDGERDHTTVEVNRPEFGGGEKMESLHKTKGMIYAQMEGESFQVLFAPVGVTTVPVRFEAKEDGVFTLNWNTMHGDFTYLHLIDNITGVDIDCLANDEYKFEGKTGDYRSRFKLVFKCEGDEPEEPGTPEDPDHFAFQFGDELVVNGEGTLQMFDISGRCMFTTQLAGVQSNVGLPKVAAGIYVLRLTNNKQMKIQKMVIK